MHWNATHQIHVCDTKMYTMHAENWTNQSKQSIERMYSSKWMIKFEYLAVICDFVNCSTTSANAFCFWTFTHTVYFWGRHREVEREGDHIDLAFAFLLTVADVVSKLNGALRLDSVNYVRSSIDFLGATILQDKFLQDIVCCDDKSFFLFSNKIMPEFRSPSIESVF